MRYNIKNSFIGALILGGGTIIIYLLMSFIYGLGLWSLDFAKVTFLPFVRVAIGMAILGFIAGVFWE